MWSLSQNKILVEGKMMLNCKGDKSTIDNLFKLMGHIKGVEQVENLVGICAACKGGNDTKTLRIFEWIDNLLVCNGGDGGDFYKIFPSYWVVFCDVPIFE